MTDSVQDSLFDVLDAVFAVNGELLQGGDLLGREVGVTSAQWQVLGVLEQAPDTAASVARRRGLARQSVQETVDRLLAQGLLKRRSNPADRRAPLLVITPSGKLAMDQLGQKREVWLAALGRDLDPEDVRRTAQVLRTLRERLGVPPRDTPPTGGPSPVTRPRR